MKGKILVIDDEKLICWSLEKDLAKEGYQVAVAQSARDGYSLFEEFGPDVILLDIRLPDGDGKEILKLIRKKDATASVVMITANDDVRTAVQCMKAGAFTYISKPFDFEEVRLNIEKAMESQALRKKVNEWERLERGKYDVESIVAESSQMKSVLHLVQRVTTSDASTILLQGESGTGKDLIAGTIHYKSERFQKSFVSVNCAALPEALLESELFGYEKGAFTDARQTKRGLVEEASGGTLFLDEIGDMQKELQAKLLRLIDQKKFRRVGGVVEFDSDARIIAATNRNLKQLANEGLFREDLYYRLNVIQIKIPPLRERKEDIPALVSIFIAHFNQEFRKSILGASPEVMKVLLNYHWPGNVRELKNVIERAMILNQGDEILSEHLPSEIDCDCILKDTCKKSKDEPGLTQLPSCFLGIPLEEIEKQVVIQALKAVKGNQSRAARMLRIGRDALRYKIHKFGLGGSEESVKPNESVQTKS